MPRHLAVLLLLLPAPRAAAQSEPEEPGEDAAAAPVTEEEAQPVEPAPLEPIALDGWEPGRVRRAELDNGLGVEILRHPHRTMAGVCVVYDAGHRRDPASLRGLARLTQQAMLGPTPGAENGSSAAHNRLGAVRSTTSISFDHASYCVELPAERLEHALHVEAGRMGYLLETLTDADVAQHRRTVIDESIGRGDQFVGWRARDSEARRLWRQHPYAVDRPDIDAVERAQLEHVQWFHQQYYAPSAARLAVVAPADPDDVLAMVRRQFGPLRGAARPRAVRAILAPLPAPSEVTIYARLFREQLSLSWITPPYYEEGDAALDVAAHALEARLEEELDRSIVAWIWVGVVSRELGSFFQVAIETHRGQRALSQLPAIEDALARLQREGITEDELARGREAFVDFDRDPSDLAFYLASHALHGREIDVGYDSRRYRDVSLAEIQSSAVRWLRPEARSLVYRRFAPDASEAGDEIEGLP